MESGNENLFAGSRSHDLDGRHEFVRIDCCMGKSQNLVFFRNCCSLWSDNW